MKKRKHYISYLGGIFTAILLCACVTTALAASGTVTFNSVNVAFNGMSFAEKDKPFQLDSGATIPSSILYTDEEGRSTTYVPIRQIADTFNIPVIWDEASNKATMRMEGELALYTMPLYLTDWAMDDCIKEVEPLIPQGGTEVLARTDHCSLIEAFTADVLLTNGNGRYVSVTVTNHNIKPVEFNLGGSYEYGERQIGHVAFPTQVPAGETVTRTIEIISPVDQAYRPLFVFVGNPDYVSLPINVTVSAVQFEG